MWYSKILLLAAVAAGLVRAQNSRIALPSQTSYLGVNIQEITNDRAKELKLSDEAGVEITRIEPESPADKAGIKVGDVVSEYNGQRVEGIEQFSRMVRETPAGRDCKLIVVRNGAAQTIMAKIGTRRVNPLDDGTIRAIPPVGAIPQLPDVPRSRMSWRNSTLGIEAELIDGQLADYFGVKEGVLVRSVSKGSVAEKAGIRAGDVITRVSGGAVTTPGELSTRLRSARNGSVQIALMRDKKETTLNVQLDENSGGRGKRVEIEGEERF